MKKIFLTAMVMTLSFATTAHAEDDHKHSSKKEKQSHSSKEHKGHKDHKEMTCEKCGKAEKDCTCHDEEKGKDHKHKEEKKDSK